MASPQLEQVKDVVEVPVPVMRAYRAALGEEEANRIAWVALEGWRKERARELGRGLGGNPGVQKWRASLGPLSAGIGDAVDIEFGEMSDKVVEWEIAGCRFADCFRELGEPELGFALCCALDDTYAEELGGGEVSLNRPSTLMQGGDRCVFRYRLRPAAVGDHQSEPPGAA